MAMAEHSICQPGTAPRPMGVVPEIARRAGSFPEGEIRGRFFSRLAVVIDAGAPALDAGGDRFWRVFP